MATRALRLMSNRRQRTRFGRLFRRMGEESRVILHGSKRRLKAIEEEEEGGEGEAEQIRTMEEEEAPVSMRILSAVIYGASSIFILAVNKTLLTTLKFPSFLVVGIGEMAATILILLAMSHYRMVELGPLRFDSIMRIFPLPLLYVVNLASGLGGTQRINLPMFTVLRRFTIPLTMLLEWAIIGVTTSSSIKLSVLLMVSGAFIAASHDLAFDTWGYLFIFVNDLATALNRVVTKQKLNTRILNKETLVFYNCVSMLPVLIVISIALGDFEEAVSFMSSPSMSPTSWLFFFLACVAGFLFNYSIAMCTFYNSALTTTCVGCVKNVVVAYGSAIFSPDFVFYWPNFAGINLSILGSVVYTFITFRPRSSSHSPLKSKESEEESA